MLWGYKDQLHIVLLQKVIKIEPIVSGGFTGDDDLLQGAVEEPQNRAVIADRARLMVLEQLRPEVGVPVDGALDDLREPGESPEELAEKNVYERNPTMV